MRDKALKNLRNKFLALFALLVLGLAGTAVAQERTGDIEGTITDSSGARIAGATVEVQADNFSRTVETGSDGRFRVLLVPPGVYTLTIKSEGFAILRVEQVTVILGRSTVVDRALEPAGIEETVVVSALSEANIATTDNKIQTSVTVEQIDLTPRGTQFSTVLKVSPATRSEPLNAGFQIDGSSGAENTFTVDGVEVTNFRTGQLLGVSNVPFEQVQEVQVKSSGFEAEYGGATGGVINVVTKGGGNQLHGSFGIQFENDSLDSGTRPVLNSSNQTLQYINPTDGGTSFLVPPDARYNNLYPSGTLGGPFVKDRLWFFLSYAPQFYTTELTKYDPSGTRSDFRTDVRQDYAFGRVDGQVGDTLRLGIAYTYAPQREEGLLPGTAAGTIINEASFTTIGSPPLDDRGGRTPSNNFSYSGIWTPVYQWTVSLRGGRNYLNERARSYGVPNQTRIRCVGAGNTNLPGVTASGACQSGFDTGNNTAINKDISTRNNFDADASYLATNFGGSHLIKFGYQLNKINNDVDLGYFNTGRIDYLFGRTSRGIGGGPGEFGNIQLTRFGTVGEAGSTNQALYVQDSWQPVQRLTLNLGIRIEREEVPTFSSTGVPIIFGWGKKPAPRLGGAFDLFGDGSTKIFASYGWFYDRFKFELPRGSFGGDRFLRTFLAITNPNINALTATDIINAPGGLTLDFRVPSNDPADNRIDPDLKAAQAREFTVGFERRVAKEFVVAARYTHKNIDRTIEDVGFFDNVGNENFFIANPGLGIVAQPFATGIPATPRAERKYDAFELRFDKRYSKNYFFNASYTYSRLFGNYSGLASSDELGRSSPNVNRFFDLPFLGFTADGVPDNGRLGTDRPHAFKLFGGYTFDWFKSAHHGTDLTIGFLGTSGSPLSTRISLYNAATFLNGRGDLGRTSGFTQTDIGVTHRIRFGENYQVAIEANILNVFNQANETRVFTTVSPSDLSGSVFTNCGTCDELDTIRAVFNPGLANQIRNLLSTGTIPTDARFGSPDRFQETRQIRLGVRFVF